MIIGRNLVLDNQKARDYKNISTFQGLNALRFFAAFLVLMHHGEVIRQKNCLLNFGWLSLFNNGGNGVTFFFVLSGFLITYLLLKEVNKTGHVNIRRFYLKRILRIWPLYFLLIFIGTVILPFLFNLLHIQYQMPYTIGQTWYYFLFFLPGLVTYFFGHHLLEPLWSIGVEEVFYLFWAPLMEWFKKHVLTLLISMIIFMVIMRFIALFYIENKLLDYLIGIFKFEAMAIGGLGAYLVYNKGKILNGMAIFSLPAQFIFFALLLIFLFFHSNIDNPYWNFFFKTPLVSEIFIDFLFLYLILCTSVIDKRAIHLQNKYLSYLGEISYGIYMYHMLAIFTTVLFLKKYLVRLDVVTGSLVFYLAASAITVLIASFSKKYFENYFLRLKNKMA